MLPLPNLDDRTFEQLLREARDLIPSVFPEWTDENTHDPGITLLEMLAWRLEVQQYRLNLIAPNHERKFLKLLGEKPRDRLPSATSVFFSGASKPVNLQAGTVLLAGDTSFETELPLTVIPDQGIRLELISRSGSRDVAMGDEGNYAPFYPFGPDGELGARLSIRFKNALPADRPLSIWIDLAHDDQGHAVRRIPPNYSAFVPSGALEWMYWHESEDGTAGWDPLPLLQDDTYCLHQSGAIRFSLPASCRRLSVRMASGVFDRVPRIDRLYINEAPAVQGRTHGVVETFNANGEPDLVLDTKHKLYPTGIVQVQVRAGHGGWIDWEEVDAWPEEPSAVYQLSKSADSVKIKFGNGITGAIPPVGSQSIRVIALSPDLYGRQVCGTGTGMSGQSAKLPLGPILPDKLMIQIGRRSEDSKSILWYDWNRVQDFDRSSPESFHYVYDHVENELRFSDGRSGAVPPASFFPNIRILALRAGGGESGNVKEGQIRILEDQPAEECLQVKNLRLAIGGAEPETTGEALKRVQSSIFQPDCGVTTQDIERLVMNIPGIHVARVKAIPGFRPGMGNEHEDRRLGDVTVAVVPESTSVMPKPSKGFIQTVRNHLEPYRLLTTRFHIVPPEYVKVSIRAIAVVDPRYIGKEQQTIEAINRLFSEWEFGRPVFKGDVYDVVHRMPGIIFIQDVWLMADGKNVYKEEGGDIRIPPNALVISGEHEIEFISSQQ